MDKRLKSNPIELDMWIERLFVQYNKKSIPMEVVFDPYTDPQLWYYIPGFNGYEISDYGNIRSFKMFNRYPFGTLVRYKYRKNSDIRWYELSDDNNCKRRMSREEIWRLAMSNPYAIIGYPRSTSTTDNQSRNKRMFIDFSKTKNASKSSRPRPIRKQETFMPHFTVIPDKIQPFRFI